MATFDPNNFHNNPIDNPYFTLIPGTTFHSASPDGSQVDVFTITHQTKMIAGVTVTVIFHTSTVDGDLAEKTFDYFAQDDDGNVWYLGEDTKEIENGKVVSTEGSWRAGVDGAEPGFIMKAAPVVGEEYDQEVAPGVAEDHAEVLALTDTVTVPYGTSTGNVLKTLETTPLEPLLMEHKFYAPGGVGQLKVFNLGTGETEEQLVKIQFDGTAKGDSLDGNFGTDELNGFAGHDSLNGMAGSDTVNGGQGKDSLDGGADAVADMLSGGAANDAIRVGTLDEASGGNGDDVITLSDNTGFGSIDGGGEPNDNVGKAAGDVLKFDGTLDLTTAGVSERIMGIETVSMKDAVGNDILRLDMQDLIDVSGGEFKPKNGGGMGEGEALRVDGDAGDQLFLEGGGWSQIFPKNAPAGYEVFAHDDPAGDVYVLVQDVIGVDLV